MATLFPDYSFSSAFLQLWHVIILIHRPDLVPSTSERTKQQQIFPKKSESSKIHKSVSSGPIKKMFTIL